MTADLLHLGPLPPLSRDLFEPDDTGHRVARKSSDGRLIVALDPERRERSRRRREAELAAWMRRRLS